ncbi:MAG: FAD-dependent monooxygenase [Rhodobacteraceae bacterium]|nr:FAD-dependent monooxygenase [Paracoccaceae bacterium]
MDAPAFFVHDGTAMDLGGVPITVLGGGVAGLAAARALALAGAAVTLIEQADAIAEVGAGLQISPNGARVLEALGLGPALEAAGMRAEAVELADEAGRPLARLAVGAARPAYRFLHRADLIGLLAEGARAAGVTLRLGERVERVAFDARGAVLVRASGAAERTPLLVGADGVRSQVRAAINGRMVPFFTRQTAWRAVVPGEPEAAPVARVWVGPGRHVVTYPLRGGALRNIVAVEERPDWAEEGWHHEDDPDRLRAAFAGFCGEVRALLGRVERVHLWGLFRHPVAKAWHAGGAAAILGDAAHPTLPFLAQGANLALEDAWVLAASLAAHATPEAALAAYQAARRDRAVRVTDAATANARNYHLRPGLRRLVAHAVLRAAGRLAPGTLLGRLDWIYGYDATAVRP